jgi:hypothetical protein
MVKLQEEWVDLSLYKTNRKNLQHEKPNKFFIQNPFFYELELVLNIATKL